MFLAMKFFPEISMKIRANQKSMDADAMCCHGVLVERDFPTTMILVCWQSGQLMMVVWQ